MEGHFDQKIAGGDPILPHCLYLAVLFVGSPGEASLLRKTIESQTQSSAKVRDRKFTIATLPTVSTPADLSDIVNKCMTKSKVGSYQHKMFLQRP